MRLVDSLFEKASFLILEAEDRGEIIFGDWARTFSCMRSLGMSVSFSSFEIDYKYSSLNNY
jgi:hypothetical protein